jgi:hypothetical protein
MEKKMTTKTRENEFIRVIGDTKIDIRAIPHYQMQTYANLQAATLAYLAWNEPEKLEERIKELESTTDYLKVFIPDFDILLKAIRETAAIVLEYVKEHPNVQQQ